MNNQAKKTKLIVINVALFILVPLLIFVGYKAYTILSEYMRAAQEYREIQDVAIDEIRTDEKDEASIVVDFSKLEEINPEVVGWIRFEEPKIINYPIVQGKDNKKYLSNIHNYSISIRGTQLFTYYEYTGEDYEADMAVMDNSPIMQEWWKYSKPCFVGHDKGEYYEDLQEVFYLK